MKSKDSVNIYYNETTDFLEVSFEEPAKAGTTEEIQTGVFVTRDVDTSRVTNVGILSFKKRVELLKVVLAFLNKKIPLDISVHSN